MNQTAAPLRGDLCRTDDAILVYDTIRAIEPPDDRADEHLQCALQEKLPQGVGLGALAALLDRYMCATKSTWEHLEKPKKCTLICCADHGVAEMQVSAYPPETTAQMTANYLLAKGAVANALANFARSNLHVADLGIKAPLPPLPSLIDRKIAHGTKNSAKGAAMTREEALRSLAVGIRLAEDFTAEGCRCFLPGEMGISNTTASAAIAACLCRLTPEQATGRGTNISDERLKKKIEVVRQSLAVNRPDASDGIDVLQKVGGFELGCIAGLILGAARRRAVVILDGFNTGAAALIAEALAPAVTGYLLPSHLAAEPAHAAILKKLGLTPYMDMRFRLGEATGSSIVADFLDAAIEAAKSLFAEDAAASDGKGAHAWKQKTAADAAQAEDAQDEMKAMSYRFLSKSMSDDADDAPDDLALPSFPALDTLAMAACQKRIDSLAKPIYSLGRLEELAVRLAGVTGEARPPLGARRALLIFAAKEPSARQKRLISAFAAHAEAPVTLALLNQDSKPAEAFAFGQKIARELAADGSLLGLALAAETDEMAREKAARYDETFRSAKEDATLLGLLQNLPPALQREAAALLGALCAAAESCCLVLLDDPATESVAHLAETLAPTLKPYLLHVQSDYLALALPASCGVAASLGMRLVDAALHMENDMKTFAETAVAVAADGPGKGRQS
ncbi:nicotinate-nucleotide--dimethylbenzimidazole phosphoribosyltransferase [Selenomonas sputigena]|uniref:Nicotinate-nucleotide--dimethylbenzimidazole phosphoribosyltransferase n=1 Tax=Selenomonas sputigena (strain ATCC 35185 / DSM 20758 / CCUG 44933 / VPI D19B-28) TaxID=546271 RepID=C9LWY2_SELS3|nr:nicotinate-nucleotide--dimethylbenzimidazole phosphoribosyltransferase [Selenomonas sputigena]AEC01121.1 nicotinate-nucleotide/dimethylbenzimidazole phosphoribosyltransferase [Selenomonas sputigena ATCC 35185]EEX76658.1 nicotinate-nucleotide--dimethylbenzimidazole phosphoribosyltransferase [Selenomonas sputigena ATCC 35185]